MSEQPQATANKLNPIQDEAMRYIDGPLLVLAGAGSGKTSVITRKIAYLIQERNYPANRITAVTFTNKAAREMKERVKKLMPREKSKGLTVSTFHQFGLQFLRYELENTPLKGNFSIMDSDDSKRLLMELMMRDNLSGAESRELVQKAMKFISDWKNELIEPDKAADTLDNPEDMLFANLYALYERNLRAYNAVDFDDLIVLPTKILRDNKQVRDKWQSRIRYLLVDEYQDTNTAQYEMIKNLVGLNPKFTVVGDDDQSIYAWRGAKPENMALLQTDFPTLKVSKLEQNYRSTSRILDSANSVIRNNEHLFEKALWSKKGEGEYIRIINCGSDLQESERVVKEILTHKLRNGNEWEDYAILYRSNFQARALEAELRNLQIPYKLSGGTSFFSRSEIRDVMSYLRIIINPEDDSAFLRVINTPKRGLGPATLEKLGNFSQEYEIPLLVACAHHGLSHVLPKKAHGTLKAFADFIEHYTRAFDQEPDPVPTVRQMIDETGYVDVIRQEAKTPQAEQNKIDNIDVLYTSIQSLIERAESEEERNLEAVIRKLVLLDMLDQQKENDDTNKVNLMTLHAAKGLEFDYVYMIGLEEEMLPHRNSILSETVEEERRLMYVGITRARKELTLTLAGQRRSGGEMRTTTQSRFLDELPEEHLDWPAKSKKKRAERDPKLVADEYMANIQAMLAKKK